MTIKEAEQMIIDAYSITASRRKTSSSLLRHLNSLSKQRTILCT